MKFQESISSLAERSKSLVKSVTIAHHERGFLYRAGLFQRLLLPGSHLLFTRGMPTEVRRVSELEPYIRLVDIETLSQDPSVAGAITSVRVPDLQRCLVFRDDSLLMVLGPGFHAFVKSKAVLRFEQIEIAPTEVRDTMAVLLRRCPAATPFVQQLEVPVGSRGMLFLDGAYCKALEPGRYMFWQGARKVELVIAELREQLMEMQGQELMTSDRVSLRLNVTVSFRVADPLRTVSGQVNAKDLLHRLLQTALREEVCGQTMDEMLTGHERLGRNLRERVTPAAEEMGMMLLRVGVRDVILPGDMRLLVNRVIEAEKKAQAELITRREETAAIRSQLNTARLLEGNPTLLRMRELESVERIAQKIGTLSVNGGIDALMTALRPLTGTDAGSSQERKRS